jgi:hypothetical protein
VLERRFECRLLDAQHLHNVPGRKSDVIDSAWCCQLLAHGLVRPSLVPAPEIRRLRDLTRLCVAQVEERTRAIQRLEKVLQDAGIKLSSVASSTYSASARALLEALLAGVSDPAALAQLAKARLRAKIPRLQEALANRFELAHHGVLVAGLLAHIDSLDQTVATLDARIAAATQPHAELVELLCTIPGVNLNTARVLIAECGLDIGVFGSAEHLVSWAAICPWPQRLRRQTPLRHDPPRQPLAAQGADRGRPRRRPQQEHLPRLPPLADPRPPRRRESDRRHPPRHPDRLLPHHPRARPLPRTRPRLARPPPLARAPHPPARQTTRSARPHGHTRGRRLTN